MNTAAVREMVGRSDKGHLIKIAHQVISGRVPNRDESLKSGKRGWTESRG